MFNGKKESKDLAMETIRMLMKAKDEAYKMMLVNKDYNERRSLERLIDSIERGKNGIQRNTCSGNHSM